MAAPSRAGWRCAARSPCGDWFWGFEERPAAFARAMSLSRPSAHEPLQQSIEVALVVPGPHRGSQPWPPRNVTHDDPALRQLRPLDGWVWAGERDEGGLTPD